MASSSKEPDFSKMFPRRFITMSMQDKYMAVCFIYDGMQFQDACKEVQPDGSFNYSEKCLSKLPFNIPSIGYGLDRPSDISLNNSERAVVPYQPNSDDFPGIFEAISYYRWEVLLLCIFSVVLFQLIFRYLNYLKGNKNSNMYRVDEDGTIHIGTLSFNHRIVLGYGSKGTCVFKGRFEGSLDCAVKRVVSEHLSKDKDKYREVDLLRIHQHPNLVRYLAREEDAQFLYIALELAEFTLADLIERDKTQNVGLSKIELCQQAALGLQYLHNSNIVHRDIKPQNILISFPIKPMNVRKVMISDFGLSKQLKDIETVHTTGAMRYFDGTQGWMAPEIVEAKLNEKTLVPSKVADIFSLGCVFYYIISGGKHPFGRADQRQDNILKNQSVLEVSTMKLFESNLDVCDEDAILANKLIGFMIQSQPDERPSINTILKYPFFWPKADQLQFLQDVSDRIDKEERGSKILIQVERSKMKIFGFGWQDCLSKELQEDLGTFRKYNTNSVRHLLRAIRNKRHHYRELRQELKDSLGDVPDGFMTYFSSRFPELLPHVYQAMQICKDEAEFKSYYEQNEDFIFN